MKSVKVKVLFLIDKEFNEVFAYFLEEKYSSEDNIFTSYSHIGQHSACHVDYAKECKEATRLQYFPLANELTSIGYKLTILNNKGLNVSILKKLSRQYEKLCSQMNDIKDLIFYFEQKYEFDYTKRPDVYSIFNSTSKCTKKRIYDYLVTLCKANNIIID